MSGSASASTNTTEHSTSFSSTENTSYTIQRAAASGSSPYAQSPAGETTTSPSRPSRDQQVTLPSGFNNGDSHSRSFAKTPDTPQSAASRFDSLHELLERAGYKETRIVTPDRHSLANMFTKATPPRRMVDDFSSDSPSLAADELRRAVQKSSASRSTPRAATSKSLPSRNYKLSTSPEASVPPLPDAAAPSSSWLSSIWFFGPGPISNDIPQPAQSAKAPEPEASTQQDTTRTIAVASTSASTSASASATASASKSASTKRVAPTPAPAKRIASNNAVWTASVAYRSAKSRTAPVRKGGAAISSNVLESDAAAEEAWKALQHGAPSGALKRRPGLVDAFSSPTKKPTSSQAANANSSPSRQRKWRQERAAWRESLGDLQAMMDQSRMRREAAAAAAAVAVVATVEQVDAYPADPVALADAATHTLSSDLSEESDSSLIATRTDEEAITKLLSGPALPFLSTDPAVAPRNASATRPTHLSMRRMKSVEVLSKIIRERRSISSIRSSSASVVVDTQAGQISPTHSRRSTPPRLTVSSPRGISSPKDLTLEGVEFEPTSWSPGGDVMISNRRVQKKPRSKLRHVSSGSDLRSAAREDGLKMPKRGRAKDRAQTEARGPVAALIRDSVGTLSRGQKPRALRENVYVFDEEALKHSEVDDSPTRTKSRRPQRAVLALSCEHNKPGCTPLTEEDDVFRPVLKKKDFTAKITRTSKIMRLIEEAENVPIATEGGQMSGSLSRRSRERMHTITRVLGQKQPA